MGDPLMHIKMAAFSDELQKEAFNPVKGIEGLGQLAAKIPSAVGRAAVQAPQSAARKVLETGGNVIKGVYRSGARARLKGPEQAQELLDRILHPLPSKGDPGGLLKGWNQMSFRGRTAAESDLRQRMIQTLQREGRAPADIKKIVGDDPMDAIRKAVVEYEKKHPGKVSPKRFLLEHTQGPAKIFGEGGLASKAEGLRAKSRAVAEELGRRGWTGAGKYTKYMPVGDKAITTGFAASAIPAVVGARPAHRTGEGGALERSLGEAGSTLGFIGGGGLGLVTGLGASVGGHAAGSRLGRTLDRLRAGASLGEAWKAPSPTQAAKQISEIQKYYG